MQRTVPSSQSDEIELYVRTYYSLLRSSGEIAIRSLEDTHAGMRSSLHQGAEAATPDVSAFLYAAVRLPPCMPDVRLLVLGQNPEQFERAGYADVRAWTPVRSAGRRRRMLFDGRSALAVLIASVSDIDDLIPIVTAYQIEWNKLHALLGGSRMATALAALPAGAPVPDGLRADLAHALSIEQADADKLAGGFGAGSARALATIAERPMQLRLRLLSGSFIDYQRAADRWYEPIGTRLAALSADAARPIYFVSSNLHSLANLLGGYALGHAGELADFAQAENPEDLAGEERRLATLKERDRDAQYANLLYYLLRHYIRAPGHEGVARRVKVSDWDVQHGIHSIPNPHHVEVDAQLIELGRIDPAMVDPRVRVPGMERLRHSPAIVLNIDYPLGMAAYHLLARVATGNVGLAGLWVMGKAATLNGRVGDVMISQVVHDEHSSNTYLFRNTLTAADIAPYLRHGTVFDNQKAITVRSAILQNRELMKVFYDEGYTVLEMEGGPYLSALYEIANPRRHPKDEIVNLFLQMPFDVGIVHYASDTPYSRRQMLLSKSLSYFGVDSTYAAAAAITRQILTREIARLGG